MIVRKYKSVDCKELTELFYNTVHEVNAKDYTKEQLNVWATGKIDLKSWNQSLLKHYSLVAVKNDIIIQQFRYRKKKYFVQNFSDRRFSF